MTIAGCYVTPEGVVLGADSTTTIGSHYFNHAQKLFEVGEGSTIGIVTWGLAGLGKSSHRTLIHTLSERLRTQKPPAANMAEVAQAWVDLFWTAYCDELAADLAEYDRLIGLMDHDPAVAPAPPDMRSEQEEKLCVNLSSNLVVGFCVAGYVDHAREPEAFEVIFDPMATAPPQPKPKAMWVPHFWGAPTITLRMILGFDIRLIDDFIASPKWTGTEAELVTLLRKYELLAQRLPIRDAVDFIHSNISSTIKALKFSDYAQTCGGPIETAVITTDRRFRWVTHKGWDSAISEGDS